MQIKTKRLAGRLVLAVLVIALGMLVRERIVATHAMVWIAAGWVLTSLMALRLGVALRRAVRAGQQHAGNGVNLATIDAATVASMPPWLRGWYAMEKRAYRSSWRALTGAPLQPSGPFRVGAGPEGGKRTLSLLMTLALCSAALGWCLPHYVAPGWPLAGAVAALVGAVLYALVWIVGERRSVKEGGHRIADGALLLELGLRASAVVPLATVRACVALGGRTRPEHAWRFTPGEAVNVAIEVTQPFAAVIRGTPRQLAAGRLLLYVDDAASFVAAVHRASAASGQVSGPMAGVAS